MDKWRAAYSSSPKSSKRGKSETTVVESTTGDLGLEQGDCVRHHEGSTDDTQRAQPLPTAGGDGAVASESLRSREVAVAEPSIFPLAESTLDDQLLVIPPDAPLVDGLRILLVHHLKRSVGTTVISLSASQAELLEHHLSRLASYAQKIVHTLAFATRFLSKHHLEGDQNETMDATHIDNFARSGMAAEGYSGAAPQVSAVEMQRPPKRSLKLNDDEIMSLFRNAQAEAAIEADWRGIPGPVAKVLSNTGHAPGSNESLPGTSNTSGFAERADCHMGAAAFAGVGGANLNSDATKQLVLDDRREDQEYLRLISRALQKSGRSPQVVAAEVVEPLNRAACCRPSVPDA